MARLNIFEPNRIADLIRKPQIVLFTVSLLIITIACFSQFDYLYYEFWSADSRLSKGPLIWIISISIILHALSLDELKFSTTKLDIVLVLAFIVALAAGLYFDPLIAPTMLVIFAWYMVSAKPDLVRMLIVWIFLLFSLPYYSQWVLGLQLLTVIVSENMLSLLGIPILVQEYYIAIPRGQFVIAEGCSGVRYLTSNLMLFFLYSLLSRFGFRQFLLGLLITVPLALLVNWIRVVSIILFAQFFGIGHDFVQDHENYGWLLYALQLVPLFYILLKIDRAAWKDLRMEVPAEKPVMPVPALALLLFPLLMVTWQQWF